MLASAPCSSPCSRGTTLGHDGVERRHADAAQREEHHPGIDPQAGSRRRSRHSRSRRREVRHRRRAPRRCAERRCAAARRTTAPSARRPPPANSATIARRPMEFQHRVVGPGHRKESCASCIRTITPHITKIIGKRLKTASAPTGLARQNSNLRRLVGRERFLQHEQAEQRIGSESSGRDEERHAAARISPTKPPSAGPG